MPWVRIDMVGGRSVEIKKELHAQVAKAVYETLGIPPEWVKVQLVEMADEDHSIGGIPINELT